MRRCPGRLTRSGSMAMLLLPLLFAGCTSDSADPNAGPLTLVEAHRWALDVAQRHAQSAHLVGFIGHEGAPPRYLTGLLGEYLVPMHTSSDAERADGRAHAWALLYGTSDGRLLRVVVRDAPRSLEAGWADGASTQLVGQLWSMNLGGRLVEDSPAVVRALIEEDERIAAFLAEHPDADVVYGSTVAPTDGAGSEDLLYEVYFATPESEGGAFVLYGQVHHFTGSVVATGDAAEARRLQRVTLVDETFTLGPVPRELETEKTLTKRVEQAMMYLNVTGFGNYVVEILDAERRAVGRAEGHASGEPRPHQENLGVLPPGKYALRVEVVGRLTFDLTIDGTIGL